MKPKLKYAFATVAFGLLLSLAATHAIAHSKMSKSIPGDGATVDVGLRAIELNFTDSLRLTVVKLKRVSDGQDGEEIAVEGVPTAFVSKAQLTVPPLESGDYEVNWMGVGRDSHVMKSDFRFTVTAE